MSVLNKGNNKITEHRAIFQCGEEFVKVHTCFPIQYYHYHYCNLYVLNLFYNKILFTLKGKAKLISQQTGKISQQPKN